jgi:hypothetical protein
LPKLGSTASSTHPRRRSPETKQQRKGDPRRTNGMDEANPNLIWSLEKRDMYTGSRIRRYPHLAAPTRPPEAERTQQIRRRTVSRLKFALIYCRQGEESRDTVWRMFAYQQATAEGSLSQATTWPRYVGPGPAKEPERSLTTVLGFEYLLCPFLQR